MDAPQSIPVTFYTKPGCHLCEDVADTLEALALRWPLRVTAIDITTDLELHRHFWDKIPVVIVGERTLYAPIAARDLAAAVAAAR